MKILTSEEIKQLQSIDCNNINVDFIEAVIERLETASPTGAAMPRHGGNIPFGDRDTWKISDKLNALTENPTPERCKQLIKEIIEFVTFN